MNFEEIKEKYTFEILNPKHDLSQFESDSNDLNDFLKNEALKQQNINLNLTRVILYNNNIIGYFSLLTDTIKLKGIKEEDVKKELKSKLPKIDEIPAIKIGRLAIDKKYTGNGLGSHILRNIIFNIQNIAKTQVGLRFITVDGYAKAYKFYTKHNGFTYLKTNKNEKSVDKINKIIQQNPNQIINLYLDIKHLE